MKEKEFINLHLQLSSDDVKKLDAWKARNGMRSRSEAIRAILKIAINATGNANLAAEKNTAIIQSYSKNTTVAPDDIEDIVRKMVKQELEKKLKK
jgi:metal-responsive CopG/Arc/MetJ family transcriptional regulator